MSATIKKILMGELKILMDRIRNDWRINVVPIEHKEGKFDWFRHMHVQWGHMHVQWRHMHVQ